MKNDKKIELSCIDALMKDYDRRTPLEDIAMYTIPSSIIGTASGFLGGLISSIITRDPVCMVYGAWIGGGIGTLIGFFSSQYVAESEYVKLHQKREELVSKK